MTVRRKLLNLDLFPQGLVPFYVSTTAGTTVYGAFDPFTDIANICEKYNLWMHVDVFTWSLSLILLPAAERSNEWTCEASAFITGSSSLLQAAWGGGLLLSKKHKIKLQGIEKYVTEVSTSSNRFISLNNCSFVWRPLKSVFYRKVRSKRWDPLIMQFEAKLSSYSMSLLWWKDEVCFRGNGKNKYVNSPPS